MRGARRAAVYAATALFACSAAVTAGPAGAEGDVELIVFARAGDLWTVPVAGGTPTQLTDTPEYEDSPSWASHDLVRYVRSSGRNQDGEVWQIPATGGAASQLSPAGVLLDDVDWSPDGQYVTYTRDLPTNPRKNQFQQDVFIADSDFSIDSERNISAHPSRDANPDFSSTGKIAFDSMREGSSSSVWVVDVSPDSVPERVATSDPQHGGKFPAWSPDGSQLVYMEYLRQDSNWGLRIVENGEERRLTTGGGNEWDAEFSPDGQHVVFSHWGGSPKKKFHIRIVRVADSTEQPAPSTEVTVADDVVSRYPSWRPNPSGGEQSDPPDPDECPLELPVCQGRF